MFSHVTIDVDDVARAIPFYDAFLGPLGITRIWTDEGGGFAGWRKGEAGPMLYLTRPFDGRPAAVGNGWMCALAADNHDSVRAAWEAAMAHGGSDEGAPGPRPHYGPDYFGAYLRDPDGNKLHVVCRGS
ncbi:VOC family protein [Gluconacetobacter takamatsuzukensis]|uniref:VOC family protein n=1 Tax=Gluconacetobacter takamatsuzukensis TaxID=1286190 RepID=A0A7W4KB05_9PROT|nr:VOC family protein [Gluconacetobacter takamatsuzukensis]MBB2203626.1 VOC family protein [Gluconacetobacter takamatsuzukensis]